MFDSNDLYTVSAGVTLYNYWNPIVTKFDSSSFYNWETDNLPLHDLEERTYELWEKATGFATSTLPGLALCVSASIPDVAASANVFTSLQDAINALPQVLRMPTLIEVAVSGDLGDIDLTNIRCEGAGSLEIVNRVFAPFDPSSATWELRDTDTNEVYRVESSEATQHIETTSALSFSANTAGLWAYPADYVAVAQMTNQRSSRNLRSQRLAVALAEGNDTDGLGSSWKDSDLYQTPDINNPSTRITDASDDVSSLNGVGALLNRTIHPLVIGSLGVNGFAVNNTIRSLSITNCTGPIWIRRFAVVAADGTSSPYTVHSTKGIKVLNTDGLTLEDMVVTRAEERGADIVNSDVTFRRRFVAHRNYEPSTRSSKETAGVYAVNSRLHFMGDSVLSGNAVLFTASHSDTGWDLRNCEVTSENAGELHAHNCVKGIKAVGTSLNFEGQLDLFECQVGLHALGSDVDIYEIVAQYCEQAGIKATNSSFVYGSPDVNPSTPLVSVGSGTKINTNVRYLFHANGQHLVLENCVWDVIRKDNNVTSTAATLLVDHFGVDTSSTRPAIDLTNSKTVLAHARVATGPNIYLGSSDGEGVCEYPVAGYLVRSRGGDTTFIGTSSIASIITGHVDGDAGSAAVAALHGARVKFQGPTFIGAASVDCIADDNGHIEFSRNDIPSFNNSDPNNHTSVQLHGMRSNLVAVNNSVITMKDLGSVVEAWGLDAGDASAIDLLHYAELSSTFNGGSMTLLVSTSSTIPHENPTYSDKYNYALDPGANFKFTNTVVNSAKYSHYLADIESLSDAYFRTNISDGGAVVRAHNDSSVRVSNVNFFCGKVNADEVFYDSSVPAGCNDLRIWTITGNSVLDAAHMSVSGAWPGVAGYTGPRAAYINGDDPFHTSSVAYVAFLGNPYNGDSSSLSSISDTSTLSILDFYGSGVEVSSGALSANQRFWSGRRYGDTVHYGENGYKNRGPFRIFFDVDPAARLLTYASGGVFTNTEDTRPYQTLAQGYELSASCSALDTLAERYYPKLFIYDKKDSELDSSGYYLASMFLDPAKQTVRLDESAAEMFANAKNAATPQRGRPSLVDIYRSTTLNYGLYRDITTSGSGYGFKGTTDFDIRRI